MHCIYVSKQILFPPVTPLLRYVEYRGIKKLFAEYQKDCWTASMKPLSMAYFYNLWRNVMNEGVYDPATNNEYTTYVRKNHCRGFAVCSTCELLKYDIAMSRNDEEKECFQRLLTTHQTEVLN